MVLHKSFSQAWYGHGPYLEMWYRGYAIVKCPLDLFMYQEIIWRTKPDLIIETGTFAGGSALFLADQLDLMAMHEEGSGTARVISVDLNTGTPLPVHDRITFIEGKSSVDLRVLEEIGAAVGGSRKVMVILDSDHSQPHVLKELNAYHGFVSDGCYLIVEDTNPDAYNAMMAQGYSRERGFANHAVKAWKPERHGFEIDKQCERFLFTQNPDGYLRKKPVNKEERR